MGIPNVDLKILEIFYGMFEDFKNGDIDHELENLFEDFSVPVVNSIKEYLADRTLCNDINKLPAGKKITFIPSFPMADMPFPQICSYVGDESADDFILGGQSGNSYEVRNNDDEIIAWDIESASYSSGSWQTDIICSHRDEVIWLSRICQLALYKNLLVLDAFGLKEASFQLTEVGLNKEHFPSTVYARRISLKGKLVNTWIKRIAAQTYDTGVNLAIEDAPEES